MIHPLRIQSNGFQYIQSIFEYIVQPLLQCSIVLEHFHHLNKELLGVTLSSPSTCYTSIHTSALGKLKPF